MEWSDQSTIVWTSYVTASAGIVVGDPSLMAFRFPGWNTVPRRGQYRNMASWDAWVSGEDSVGHVKRQRGRRADIVYNIGERDMEVQESMAKLCEMFFYRCLIGHGRCTWIT